MATVEETIITGRKYRIWDAVNNIWKRVSYWTKASDVEFDDGQNAEDKLGTLKQDLETEIEENYNTLSEELTTKCSELDSNKINKSDLVFSLSGTTLRITKTY